MKKILILGGAGYLGSVLCRKLLDKGYKVRVLDCLIYGDRGIKDLYKNPNFELKKGDIRDISCVMESVKGIDGVIHLAAIVGDPSSSLRQEEAVEINYLATKMLAWICKYYKIRRFIFSSTASVYGSNEDGGILTEKSKTNPLSLYSQMKLKSELGLINMKGNDFSPCIFRMGTLYGLSPRMRFDLVVNWFVVNAIKEKKFSLFGGNQERCFCHIEDAADAYIKCLESPIKSIHGEIFNISSKNLKIIDLGEIIIENIPNSSMKINEKDLDNRSYVTSSEKAKNIIKWNPKRDIKDFIDDMKGMENQWDDYLDPIYSNYEYLKKHGLRKI